MEAAKFHLTKPHSTVQPHVVVEQASSVSVGGQLRDRHDRNRSFTVSQQSACHQKVEQAPLEEAKIHALHSGAENT